jgi:hypothetical protein
MIAYYHVKTVYVEDDYDLGSQSKTVYGVQSDENQIICFSSEETALDFAYALNMAREARTLVT